jgi:hypothetical protein
VVLLDVEAAVLKVLLGDHLDGQVAQVVDEDRELRLFTGAAAVATMLH